LTRLGAIDALVRGVANVRANWELLLLQLLSTVVLFVLAAGSIVPLVAVLGLRLGAVEDATMDDVVAWLDPARWLALLDTSVVVALLAGLVIGTLAIAAYGWFQAGIYGVLTAGDLQAGAGPGRPRALFRTFSTRDFGGWAARGTGRFFLWYHLYLTLALGLGALFAALLGGALALGLKRGALAGFGIGCGGLLPLVALGLFLGLASQAAKSDLMRDGSGAARSWRRGGRVVARRLGAALLLLVLVVAASTAASMVLLPLQLVGELGTSAVLGGVGAADGSAAAGAVGLSLGLQAVIWILQMALGSVLGLVYGASWVALVRAEIPDS
jgi:hypothetical protein